MCVCVCVCVCVCFTDGEKLKRSNPVTFLLVSLDPVSDLIRIVPVREVTQALHFEPGPITLNAFKTKLRNCDNSKLPSTVLCLNTQTAV